MNKLEKARIEINDIDRDMARLFEKRMKAVEDVILFKLENDMPIFDKSREMEVIDKNSSYINNCLYVDYYKMFIKDLMDISKEYQYTIINKEDVGYGGTKGAFSHIACSNIFPSLNQKEYKTFEEVFEAVESGEIAYGVIPFENSYTGEVGEVLDFLYKYDVYINKVYDLKINQNLLGVKGSTINDIKKVYSHQQAISQSSQFLKSMNFEVIPYENTALAARYVSEENDKSKAAIASRETAKLYNLDIIVDNINTSSANTTRFIVISKKKEKEGNRVSLIFTVNHNAGQLAHIMQLIGNAGYNMESIKSRSIHNEPWKYYFYVEIVGNLSDDNTNNLINEIKEECEIVKVLGTYTI